MGSEMCEMFGLLEKGGKPVANQIDGGFVPCNEKQNCGADQLGTGELIVTEARLHELAEQVGSVATAVPADVPPHVKAEAQNVGIEVGSTARDDAGVDDFGRPTMEAWVIGDGHAEHISDDGQWQW